MKTYKFKINGNDYEVAINSVEGKNASVSVNGVEYTVEMEQEASAAPAPAQAPARPAAPEEAQLRQQAATGEAPLGQQAAPVAAGSGYDVTSPLPGVILSVNVAVGDKVAAGAKVAVLEAMKMENDIEAEKAGTVTAIHVSKGDSILEGAKIVTIA